MTMGILFLWRWELLIVTYNKWNKTPESIFQIARGQWANFIQQGCRFVFCEPRFWNSGFFGTPLAFFGNKKKQDKIWIFSVRGLTLEKHCLNCIFIINLFWKESTTIFTGKENTSKEWNCIIPMFLTSFNVYFVFGYAYFMCRLHA